MDKSQSMFYLWHDSTGLPCYAEGSVPDDAKLPYVTYETIIDSLDSSVMPTATVWMRTDSWTPLDEYQSIVENYIDGGRLIKMDVGSMMVHRGTPFAQRTTDENDKSIKGYLFNIEVEFLSH